MYSQQQQRAPGAGFPSHQAQQIQQHQLRLMQQQAAQQQQAQAAQQAQQQQAQTQKRPMPNYWDVLGSNDAFRRAKRHAPTDRVLPPFPPASPSSSAHERDRAKDLHRLAESYAALQKVERKLDWTVSRKRTELREAIESGQTVKRTLRLKIWNTVKGQKWQQPKPASDDAKEAVSAEEGAEAKEGESEAPKEGESTKGGAEAEAEKKDGDAEGGIPGLGQNRTDAQSEAIKADAAKVNFTTGEGVPQWTLNIEGHLLEPPSTAAPDAPEISESPRLFSTLLKAIIIRLDRADGPFPEPNHVEWHRPSQPPAPNPQNPSAAAAAPPEPFSAFTLTRTGSEDVRVFIALHLDQAPERVKVNPALGHFLDVTEESMPGIVQALWAYVKKERLQDGEDKRFIRKDGNLAYLFGGGQGEKVPFHYLEDVAKRFILPADPLVIPFDVKVSEPEPDQADRARYVDIVMEIADPARLQMKQVEETLGGADPISREIRELDEQIADKVARIKESHKRRAFFEAFSSDPVDFLSTWLSSQSADLETVLGRERGYDAAVAGGLRGEQMRDGRFFKEPWVQEGIALYESRLFAQKVADAAPRR